MSLIIISEPKNKNGKYELTEEKLRELIQEAYDKGYKDGQAKPKYELQPYTLPGDGGLIKQPNINDPFWYERNPTPWWKEVTCDTVPDVNYVPGVTATGTQGSDSTSGSFKGNVKTTLLNCNCMKQGDVFPDDTECNCCGGAK